VETVTLVVSILALAAALAYSTPRIARALREPPSDRAPMSTARALFFLTVGVCVALAILALKPASQSFG
jgi:hypothetical protein